RRLRRIHSSSASSSAMLSPMLAHRHVRVCPNTQRQRRYTRLVSVAALPYTLLLILAELSIGSLWVTLGADLRGGVTRGFVMTMAFCVVVTAVLTYWTA